MAEEYENIELRSGEVQEILGTPPRWIIRWGTVLIFLLLAVLIGVGYMVRYPDIIPAPINLSSDVPTVKVIAQTSGYIEKLMVEEGDQVFENQLIAVMKTTANYDDIEKISAEADSLLAGDITLSVIKKYNPVQALKLGQAQTAYDEFFREHQRLNVDRDKKFQEEKEKEIRGKIKKVESKIKKLGKREKNAQKAVDMAKRNFEIQQTLYKKKATTISELQTAKQEIFKTESSIEEIKMMVDDQEEEILQYESEITSVKQQATESKGDKLVNVKVALKQLSSELLLWKEKNQVKANSNGVITFFGSVKKATEFVNVGDEIMAIIPEGTSAIIGQARIPLQGAGKVEVGQRVIVKLDGYPHEEYGTITGEIFKIPSLPKNGAYLVTVNFPNGLKTSYDKFIKFQQDLPGNAEIITKDRRLLDRIFERIITMIKERQTDIK